MSKLFFIFLPTKKLIMAPSSKASSFLIFPWGLLSIVLVLALNLALDDAWFNKNWSWIALVLIIPAAILENFKVGYSTMRIMFFEGFLFTTFIFSRRHGNWIRPYWLSH